MQLKALNLYFLLAFMALLGYAQDAESYTLKGKIIDPDINEGLPGATIMVEGTTTGTITDFDGNFSLTVKSNDVLNVTFVGYTPQSIPVNGRSDIEVILQPDVTALDEVVVTGYGEISKSDLTGAVSSVDIDEIKNVAVSDVSQALQGRIAGVQVTPNSGSPGAGTAIRIRGVGTITGDASPLYVVDGVVVNEINYLSQNDIKSIEIMKDASVASLYGSRAANGVVVIQTKQGSAGDVKINVTSQYGLQNLWNEPDLMNTSEFFQLKGLANGGSPEVMGNLLTNLETAEDNDWLDLITRTGTRQQHSLSFSGGTERMTYRLSSNFFNEKGIVINSDFTRINVLSDLTFDITDNINLRANVLYSNAKRNVQDTESKYSLFRRVVIDSPDKELVDEDGFLNNTPLLKAKDNVDERGIHNLQTKFFFNYKISPELKFTSRFGMDQNRVDRHQFSKPGTAVEQTLSPNSFAAVTETSTLTNKVLWEQVLSFNKKISGNNLSLTGAFSMERQEKQNVVAKGSSPLGRDESTAYLSNAFRSLNVNGATTAWSQMGVVFRSNYSIQGKYVFQANLRSDGSSRFAKGNRWGFFPSASAAWVFSEDLLPGNAVLQNGKLRVSYGVLGNNRINNYESVTTLGNGSVYAYGADDNFNYYTGYAATEIGNSDISWERTYSYNLGVDLDLYGHVFLTTDVFRRHTKDMLLNVPVPQSIGFSSTPRRNIGEVINDGIELSASYRNSIGDLSIDLSANGTYLINNVLELGVNNDPVYGGYVNNAIPVVMGNVTKTVVGRPIGTFYGRVTDGLDENGNFIFKDLNNDGKITLDDRTYLGSPIPNVTYGGVINLGYRNFDFVAQLQGVHGNSVFNVLRYHTHGFNGTRGLSSILDDVWTTDLNFEGSEVPADIANKYQGGNQNPTLPRAMSANNDESYRHASDFYVEDASYLRVKNVQLGYTFDDRVLSRLQLRSLRLYVSAQNLLTFTKYEGFDPEVGGGGGIAAGIDYGSYPQGRLYLIGVDFNL
ncbi:SusC/RagA family TonB-linked outer membrane protein [Marinoscillum furvescens]|uniref:TonB-linked SusC/RagA family outer membrane protein n=1 Tax=Marinoscillum furvescens DSM 4134 TaxID=1122208 RepID=A0A3D9L3Y7_MARFU|nr:TonB-dependent receptor [Marinoscillum furvescens]REE00169.1 TonB-linked SusC/RagA family outer membrane protein [Marinoscillum furvescens DSM 4134]